MSTLEMNEKGFSFLRGVHLAFVKFIKPDVNKFKGGAEQYTFCVVMDKATSKTWKKEFPVNSVKAIDTEDFKEKYGFDAPYPKQDDQFVYTFRADKHFGKDWKDKKSGIEYRAGDEVPTFMHPDILKASTADGQPHEDITFTTYISNGSVADVAIFKKDMKEGHTVKAKTVLVTELIEHESEGGNGGGGAFGAVVSSSKPKVQAEAETSKQSQPEPEIDFDDTIPF